MIKCHIKTDDFECIDFDYENIDELKSNYADDCIIARKEHLRQALTWKEVLKESREKSSPK